MNLNSDNDPKFDRFLKIYFMIVIFLYTISICLKLLGLTSYAFSLTDQTEVEKEVEKELTEFLPDGYHYYIAHHWSGEETYPLIFFKDVPVFDSVPDSDSWGSYHHVYSSDGSDPLFYDFFSEEDLLNFVENNILTDDVRIRENYSRYARLSVSPVTYYTNVDLIYSDTGESYARSNPYTTTVTEMVPGVETTIVGMTSDDISSGVLSVILLLLPVCLVVFVGYIGFRKGITFVSNLLKGA